MSYFCRPGGTATGIHESRLPCDGNKLIPHDGVGVSAGDGTYVTYITDVLWFFGKYPAMDVCPLLPECYPGMAQTFFSTGPRSSRRGARNESKVGLNRTDNGSLFQSEMVGGKKE